MNDSPSDQTSATSAAATGETSAESVAKVVDLLRDARFSMVTSIGASGALQSRPMTIQRVEDDGDLWFLISRSHDQARAIGAEPRVNVAVSGDSSWVSVSGDGEIVRERGGREQAVDRRQGPRGGNRCPVAHHAPIDRQYPVSVCGLDGAQPG